MSAVGSKNTGPELALRKALFKMGYRYRLHRRDLPGTPDIVFHGRGKVIFVHGCFWHGHACRYGQPPKTRQAFWTAKITANVKRDKEAQQALNASGWSALTVWQCQLRHLKEAVAVVTAFLGPTRLGNR
jgi:DNA mismatch endonuclease (patch repair protein)